MGFRVSPGGIKANWAPSAVVAALLFTFASTPRPPAFDRIIVLGVLGSAGLNVIAYLASTRALKLADASLVTPLLIFSPVFTVLISAVFLNEIPSARGWLDVGLVLVGAY